MNDNNLPFCYQVFTPEGIETNQSNIAIEASVSLTVNGQVWIIFQCTPENLEALAVGFLYNESFIQSMNDIASIHVCNNKDNVDVWINHAVQKPEFWRRTSGCHGGTSSPNVKDDQLQALIDQNSMQPEEIFLLADQFLTKQVPHSVSGGVHTSALADYRTQVFQIHDIGRHNTFDKIAGHILLNNLEIEIPVLLTSGRISSDIVLKSLRMRASFVISMRSASQLAITMAEQWGVTLIVRARRDRFHLLCHPERIRTE